MLTVRVQPVNKNIVCTAELRDGVQQSVIERSALRILKDNLALQNCVLIKVSDTLYSVYQLTEPVAYVNISEGDNG